MWQKTSTIVWTSEEIETLRITIESGAKEDELETKKPIAEVSNAKTEVSDVICSSFLMLHLFKFRRA